VPESCVIRNDRPRPPEGAGRCGGQLLIWFQQIFARKPLMPQRNLRPVSDATQAWRRALRLRPPPQLLRAVSPHRPFALAPWLRTSSAITFANPDPRPGTPCRARPRCGPSDERCFRALVDDMLEGDVRRRRPSAWRRRRSCPTKRLIPSWTPPSSTTRRWCWINPEDSSARSEEIGPFTRKLGLSVAAESTTRRRAPCAFVRRCARWGRDGEAFRAQGRGPDAVCVHTRWTTLMGKVFGRLTSARSSANRTAPRDQETRGRTARGAEARTGGRMKVA